MTRLGSVARRARAAISLNRIVGHSEQLLHELKNDVAREVDKLAAENVSLHRSVSEQFGILSQQVQVLSDHVRGAHARLDEIVVVRGPRTRVWAKPIDIDDIDAHAASFLNDCTAADGPLRQTGHFVNHPLTTIWKPGEVVFEAVNERIIELPYAHRATARLERGSRILDVGGAESTLGLELASMGYAVTVVEPRGYPLEHPNLDVVARGVEVLDRDGEYDAAVLLSTIEHIGVGSYALQEAPDLDFAALRAVWRAVVPGGLLVLTTPFGEAAENDLERTYDLDRLERLLTGWAVQDVQLIVRRDRTTWEMDEREVTAAPDGQSRVVLLTARKLDDPDAPATGLA